MSIEHKALAEYYVSYAWLTPGQTLMHVANVDEFLASSPREKIWRLKGRDLDIHEERYTSLFTDCGTEEDVRAKEEAFFQSCVRLVKHQEYMGQRKVRHIFDQMVELTVEMNRGGLELAKEYMERRRDMGLHPTEIIHEQDGHEHDPTYLKARRILDQHTALRDYLLKVQLGVYPPINDKGIKIDYDALIHSLVES